MSALYRATLLRKEKQKKKKLAAQNAHSIKNTNTQVCLCKMQLFLALMHNDPARNFGLSSRSLENGGKQFWNFSGKKTTNTKIMQIKDCDIIMHKVCCH